MAEIKPQRYKETRPAELFAPIHEWSRTHDAGWTYELVRMVMTFIALIFYRARPISTDNVPPAGACILAPNHFSNMDHFFVGIHTRRKVRFMAKSQMFFRSRVLDYIYRVGGVFPVRRGQHDDEAFITAHSILDRGGCVLMYAEGGRSRSQQLGEPKAGLGKLALEAGVPVVPVAIHGSKSVRAWKRFVFPKVTVQFGEPISIEAVAEPDREQQLEASREIFDHVRTLYTALDEQGRAGVLRSLREKAAKAVAPGSAGRAHS